MQSHQQALSAPITFFPRGKSSQVIIYCCKTGLSVNIGLVLSVYRGAVHRKKEDQSLRRLRASKAMATGTPAQHVKKLRVLRLEADKRGPRCWSGTSFSQIALIDPLESFIFVAENPKVAEDPFHVVVQLSEEAFRQIGEISSSKAPWQFFKELQHEDTRAVRPRPGEASSTPIQLFAAEDLQMNQKGKDNAKAYMTQLPAMFASLKAPLLDKHGCLPFNAKHGLKKKISWEEVVLRAPQALQTAFASNGKAQIGENVLQQLQKMTPKPGQPGTSCSILLWVYLYVFIHKQYLGGRVCAHIQDCMVLMKDHERCFFTCSC